MNAQQLELRAIPQFDSGRWKLRLERVPVHPDNENTMGVDLDSAAQASVNETNQAHWFPLPVERGRRETINILSNESGARQRLAKQAPTVRSRYPQSH
jgi:hypothetical protein